jgi:hypothetical protein
LEIFSVSLGNFFCSPDPRSTSFSGYLSDTRRFQNKYSAPLAWYLVSRGGGREGPQKTKINGSLVHLLNPRPTHPPAGLFVLVFLVRFWAFLGKGSSKTPQKHFCKNSMSKSFPQKIDKIFDVSFSSMLLLNRVFGCCSAMGVQKHYKTNYKKRRVDQLQLQKIRPKIQNRFILGFVLSRFWAFLGEGIS